MRTMLLVDVLRDYRDGDDHGWEAEFSYLRSNHANRLRDLNQSVSAEGIKRPILLGTDGRIWDGHHRLCSAYDLGIKAVPVVHAQDE